MSCKPAIDTGKKDQDVRGSQDTGLKQGRNKFRESLYMMTLFFWSFLAEAGEKKVVKPHDRLVILC